MARLFVFAACLALVASCAGDGASGGTPPSSATRSLAAARLAVRRAGTVWASVTYRISFINPRQACCQVENLYSLHSLAGAPARYVELGHAIQLQRRGMRWAQTGSSALDWAVTRLHAWQPNDVKIGCSAPLRMPGAPLKGESVLPGLPDNPVSVSFLGRTVAGSRRAVRLRVSYKASIFTIPDSVNNATHMLSGVLLVSPRSHLPLLFRATTLGTLGFPGPAHDRATLSVSFRSFGRPVGHGSAPTSCSRG